MMNATRNNFPYSVDDEPTEDWTVDHVLQWYLLRAKNETDVSCQQMISQLQEQLSKGTNSLWKDHESMLPEGSQSQSELQQKYGQESSENENPQQPVKTVRDGSKPTRTNADKATTNAKAGTTSSKTKSAIPQFNVEIVAGHYAGTELSLDFSSPKGESWVGRSQSKKYAKHGISLPKDAEVSTTHGLFKVQRDGNAASSYLFWYRDEGSTNGTMVQGQAIQPYVDIPLESGMEVQVGATTLVVTF